MVASVRSFFPKQAPIPEDTVANFIKQFLNALVQSLATPHI